MEDGREIFDDDMDEESLKAMEKKKRSKMSKAEKDQAKAEKQAQNANFHSVRDMLKNMPVKRKRAAEMPSSTSSAAAGSVDEDELTKDLLAELRSDKKSQSNDQLFKKLVNQQQHHTDFMARPKPKPNLMLPKPVKKFKPMTVFEPTVSLIMWYVVIW